LEQVLFVVGGTCNAPKISKSTSWQTLKIPRAFALADVKRKRERVSDFGASASLLAGEFMREFEREI